MTAVADPAVVERPSVRWERTASSVGLDASRYLGVRSELPQDGRPGDWCTVVVVDGLGELEWTFVAVAQGRSTTIHEPRPRAPRRAADTAAPDGAPLGGALRWLPQAGRSAPPSGEG